MKKEALSNKKDIENTKSEGKQSTLVLFLVLFITAIVFSGTLNLSWTNWDDNLYIYENPLVSKGTLKDIFTPPANPANYNTYSPLVISFFALEWKLVKDQPFLYHLNNLLLHLLCTALALLFFRRMGLSIWWSGFAAMLFGIHPMRVESVAWITERKDLLYALFYLATIIAYIRYIDSQKNRHLLLTFFFFALSLYSKIQAVILPFVLILLDWYFQRKISPKTIIEKVIFFAGTMTIGVSMLVGFNFLVKKADVITYNKVIFFLKHILLGGYSYVVYILKSFVPYETSVLYPPPASLQIEHWVGAVIAFMLFISALTVWRKYRFVTFGMIFFTINLVLIPMASMVGDSTFINDRYTYIAYIGLFFIMAMGMQRLSGKFSSFRLPAAIIAVVLLIVLCVLTTKYIPIWKNSETLWTDVIEKYPRKIPFAYLNRGNYLYSNNQSDKALEDFNTAIELNPEYRLAYLNRSFIYLDRNDNEKALQDYNSYIEHLPPSDISGNFPNPLVSDVLGNRGLIYSKMGQYEKSLVDFNLAIRMNPFNSNNYLNRAFAYYKLGNTAEAKQDLLTAEKKGATIDPAFRKTLQLR